MKKVFAMLMVAMAAISMSFLPYPSNGYKVGDTARDFNLKNVDGKQYTLSGISSAKGYIVVFTCNHCPFAKAYESRIIDLHKKYAPKGYPVVAISSNDAAAEPSDSYENMQQRSKDKHYPFAYLYDESQEIAKTYGATRPPHVFLLDKDRVVRYIGAIDDNSEEPTQVKEKYLENAVDALIAGKPVPTAETKAIGCSIKWKKS
jgi:peroxiredoxin